MIDRWTSRFLIVAVIWGATAILVQAVLDYVIDTRPPITIKSVEALNSPVTPGEALRVRIHREKVRDCPLTSVRWAMDMDGRRHYLPGSVDVKGGPVGSRFVDVDYPIVGLTPGQYVLGARVYYACPDALHIIEQSPLPFRVK